MRLLGKNKLQRLLSSDDSGPASIWVRAWTAELTGANWKQPTDVSQQFPNVRRSEAGHFIFPINNSNQEVYLQIAFQQGIAIITGLQ